MRGAEFELAEREGSLAEFLRYSQSDDASLAACRVKFRELARLRLTDSELVSAVAALAMVAPDRSWPDAGVKRACRGRRLEAQIGRRLLEAGPPSYPVPSGWFRRLLAAGHQGGAASLHSEPADGPLMHAALKAIRKGGLTHPDVSALLSRLANTGDWHRFTSNFIQFFPGASIWKEPGDISVASSLRAIEAYGQAMRVESSGKPGPTQWSLAIKAVQAMLDRSDLDQAVVLTTLLLGQPELEVRFADKLVRTLLKLTQSDILLAPQALYLEQYYTAGLLSTTLFNGLARRGRLDGVQQIILNRAQNRKAAATHCESSIALVLADINIALGNRDVGCGYLKSVLESPSVSENDRSEAHKRYSVSSYASLALFNDPCLSQRHPEPHLPENGKVVVLVEQGANINFLSEKLFKGREIIVYSAADVLIPEGVDVSLGSFRDKVGDHSPASDHAYEFSIPFAKEITELVVNQLDGVIDHFSDYAETVSLFFEDQLTANIIRMECFRECLAEVDDVGCVLVALASGKSIGPLLPLISPDEQLPLVRLVSTSAVPKSVTTCHDEILKALNPKPVGNRSSEVAIGTELDAAIEKVGTDLEFAAQRYCRLLSPGYELVACHLRHESYGSAILPLLSALANDKRTFLVYDISQRPWFGNERADLEQKVGSACRIMTLGWIRGWISKTGGLAPAVMAVHDRLHSYITELAREYQGRAATGLILSAVLEHWKDQGAALLAQIIFIQKVIAAAPPAITYACSTRMYAIRIMSASCRRAKVPVLDIQALNVLRYPKYRAPDSDLATVIDDISRDIYVDYLGVEPSRVVVTGTPRVDVIRRETLSIEAAPVLARLGLPLTQSKTIMFASQLQPIERCSNIVEVLCRVSASTGASLLIKLHPREGEARKAHYQAIVDRFPSLRERVAINRDLPIQAALAVSDIVVTMFSNVAREALIVGRDVVIANYFDTELPVRFDLEGATGAYSESQLGSIIEDLVSPCDSGGEGAKSLYFERNPHLLDGDSLEVILQAGADLARRKPVSRKPALASLPASNDLLSMLGDGESLAFALESFRFQERDEKADLVRLFGDRPLPEKFAHVANEILLLELAGAGVDDCVVVALEKILSRCRTHEQVRQSAELVYDKALNAGRNSALLVNRLSDMASDASSHAFCGYYFLAAGQIGRASKHLSAVADLGRSDQLLAADLRSLEPVLISGPTDRESTEANARVVLICDRSTSPESFRHAIDAHQPEAVLFEKEPIALDGGSSEWASCTVKEMVPDDSELLTHLAQNVAGEFSSRLHRGLMKSFENSSERDFLERQGAAIRQHVRSISIDPIRLLSAMEQFLGRYRDCDVVLCCANPTSIDHLRHFSLAAPTRRFLVSASSNRRAVCRQVLSVADQVVEMQRWPLDHVRGGIRDGGTEGSAPPDLAPLLRTSHIEPIPRSDKDRVLIVGRWKLKTAQQTLDILLKEAPLDLGITAIAPGSAVGDAVLHESMKQLVATNPAADVRFVAGSQLRVDAPSGDAGRSAIIEAWRCSREGEGADDLPDPMVEAMLARVVEGGARFLPYIFALDEQAQEFMKGPGRTVVMVCPGRHSEALVVQDAARFVGRRSIDVQNAYMTRGYTYTKPHGDVVTAIDRWSSELFVNDYGLPPAAVHVIGTPRFDRLPTMSRTRSAEDIRSTSAELGFVDDKLPLVVFAVQPIGLEKNRSIIQAIACANPGSSRLNILVKLHPRETDQSFAEYRDLCSSILSQNEIICVRDHPLEDPILAAAAVVTIFSNVGIEAAIWGRDVVVANLGQAALPLPLDDFLIGVNAFTETELSDAISGLIDDPTVRELCRTRREKFFSENPQLLEGKATEKIWALARENMQ